MLKRKTKKYASGGLTPEEELEYQRLANMRIAQDPIQDDLGMTPMQNNIQNQPSTPTDQPTAAAEPGKKKSKFGANLGKVTLSTMPLLEAADALVTNLIYNPQIKRREAQLLRDTLNPVISPSNFAGSEDQRIYADGGYVTRKAGKKKNIVVEEYVPDNHTPMNSLSLYNTSGVPAPQFRPIAQPKAPVTFEQLYDSEGNITNYSPVFGKGYTRSDARRIMNTLPNDFGGVPVIKSMDLYGELWDMPYGSTADTWAKFSPGNVPSIKTKSGMVASTFARGGVTNANAIVEGGEFMQLPDGKTAAIEGDKHSDPSGGEHMNLPGGTRIFSDKLKPGKEFTTALLDRKSKDMTYSKLAKKFDTTTEDAILNDLKADPIAKRTAELMKARKEEALNNIFIHQESSKGDSGSGYFAAGGEVEEEKKGKKFMRKVGNTLSKAGNSLGNMLPEIVATINNMTDIPIYQPKYQPQYLSRPQQLNVQAGLNRNLSQVKPFLDSNSGDAAIDNARALQALGSAQDADNQLLQQKFNYDADARFQVDKYNTDLANQAQMINLQQADRFWDKYTRRAQAKQQQFQNIVQSAYHKDKAMQREERSLDLVNQMYPNMQYDPVTGQMQYVGEQSWRVPTLYNQKYGMDPNDNVQTTSTVISDGRGGFKRVVKNKEMN